MTANKIILFSGGIDSTILVLRSLAYNINRNKIILLHIRYDHPSAESEFNACFNIWQELNKHYPNSLEFISCELPIDAQNMKTGNGKLGSRVVPNRNSIMLNMAINIAVCNNVKVIEYGAVLDDNNDYLDCRPEFLAKMNLIAKDWNIKIKAPLMFRSKEDIMIELEDSNIKKDILLSCSSCYQPINVDAYWVSCGKCNSCLSNDIKIGDQRIYNHNNDDDDYEK